MPTMRPLASPVPQAAGPGVTEEVLVVRALAVAALAVAVTSCAGTSGSGSPSPTASAARTATTSAPTPATPGTPTPSPSADTDQVEVVASGIGAHDLQVVPVAVLRNLANAHTASGVVVTFSVQRAGGSYSLTAAPVSLAPGETLADAALCTDACDGATGTVVAVTVASWVSGTRPVLSATPGSYTCGAPCGGGSGYQGDVSASLSGSPSAGALVNLYAVCWGSSGAVVGGGLSETMWTGGTSVHASVPVLVSVQPSSCQLYATQVG